MRNSRFRSVMLWAALAAALAGTVTMDSAMIAYAATPPLSGGSTRESSTDDPLMDAARAELTASNRHDLSAFLHAFTQDPAILVDASPYSYHHKMALGEFFRKNPLGSQVQYTIEPGAPQTEDRVGNHAYLEIVVNVRATDSRGDSFNDRIHWIAALERDGGGWKIDVLTLTTTGG
ncbi:MAG TPA: hypothetical protein VIC29_08860 [Steroidobacteraceae bacterium]